MRCIYCAKDFKSKQGLEKHISKLVCKRKTCKYCQKKFSNVFNKNNHESKKVCCKDKKIFQCDGCSKILSTNQRLKSHKEVCGTEDFEFNKLNPVLKRRINNWVKKERVVATL